MGPCLSTPGSKEDRQDEASIRPQEGCLDKRVAASESGQMVSPGSRGFGRDLGRARSQPQTRAVAPKASVNRVEEATRRSWTRTRSDESGRQGGRSRAREGRAAEDEFEGGKSVFSAETVSKLEQQTSTIANSASTSSSRRESLDTVSSSNSSRSQRSAKHTASVTTSSVSHDGASYTQLNQYVIIKDLGRGVHAKVSLALNTANNNFYAVKATNNNAVLAETAVRKEIAVLKKLEHDNVLKLFEVVDDPDNGELLLVLEYAEGGPIYTRYNRTHLSEDVVLKYTRDIIQGLDYLHHVAGIAHMDMKPENLLKSADGTVKIADFGVSFVGRKSDPRALNASKRIVGTPAFIAPEILGDDGYDPYSADIWSLGICIFHMSTAKLPFVGRTIFQIVAMAKRQGLRFPPNPGSSQRSSWTLWQRFYRSIHRSALV